GPELKKYEGHPVLAQALLSEQDRTFRGELYRNSQKQVQRRKGDQRKCAADYIHEALYDQSRASRLSQADEVGVEDRLQDFSPVFWLEVIRKYVKGNLQLAQVRVRQGAGKSGNGSLAQNRHHQVRPR